MSRGWWPLSGGQTVQEGPPEKKELNIPLWQNLDAGGAVEKGLEYEDKRVHFLVLPRAHVIKKSLQGGVGVCVDLMEF